jgi:hypothetical protein
MFVVEMKADFRGHQIVILSGQSGAKLYIDGAVVDTSDGVKFSKENPIPIATPDIANMRGSISEGDKIHIVEAFAAGRLIWVWKLCVDGERIAGAEF